MHIIQRRKGIRLRHEAHIQKAPTEEPACVFHSKRLRFHVLFILLPKEGAAYLKFGGAREYNKFCVNSIEKKASLLDWC